MKFDCGPTRAEVVSRLEKWHPFFCLFPRRIGSHDCRWLETIQRKGTWYNAGYDGGWHWEYKA